LVADQHASKLVIEVGESGRVRSAKITRKTNRLALCTTDSRAALGAGKLAKTIL
jgi:hypothetical protein